MKEITLTVDNIIRIPLAVLKRNHDNALLGNLKSSLIHDNPAYHLGLAMAGGNRHAVKVPKTICSFSSDTTHLKIPRGLGPYARVKLIESGYVVHIKDERVTNSSLEFEVIPGWELRPHQTEVKTVFSKYEQGVLEAPCGSGKTVSLITEIVEKNQTTIIIVHKKDLVKQWTQEIMEKFVLKKGKVGMVGEGTFELGPITIGMVQTLIRLPEEKWNLIRNKFGMAIVDECHHVPAETFYKVINKFPAKYRFGASATPKRKDNCEFLLYEYMGNLLHRVDDTTLEEQGITMKAIVKKVLTPYYFNYTKPTSWVFMISGMAKNKQRNEIIVKTIAEDVSKGNLALVLSDRVEHCKFLSVALEAFNIKSRLLIGEKSGDERERVRKECIEGKVNAVIGTTVADEGLDVPNLNSIHLTCPSNNEGKLKQRVGRIKRQCEGKGMPTIYDYVDHNIEKCCSTWSHREAWYSKWGFIF